MTVIYSRGEKVRDWLKMSRLQVRIWNVLSDGPLNGWQIYTRLPGTEYGEIINALADMARKGDVNASYSQ